MKGERIWFLFFFCRQSKKYTVCLDFSTNILFFLKPRDRIFNVFSYLISADEKTYDITVWFIFGLWMCRLTVESSEIRYKRFKAKIDKLSSSQNQQRNSSVELLTKHSVVGVSNSMLTSLMMPTSLIYPCLANFFYTWVKSKVFCFPQLSICERTIPLAVFTFKAEYSRR